MEKLLAPLFPAGSLGTFFHSLGRIFGKFFWDFFGIFWDFGNPSLSRDFPPDFLRISPQNPGSNPTFPIPNSHFLTTSDSPTKFREHILGWGNPKQFRNEEFPARLHPKDPHIPRIPEQPPGLELRLAPSPIFLWKISFSQAPLGAIPFFTQSPEFRAFCADPGMGRAGIPPRAFSQFFKEKLIFPAPDPGFPLEWP